MHSRWENITKSLRMINMVYELVIKTNYNIDFSKWCKEIKITTVS